MIALKDRRADIGQHGVVRRHISQQCALLVCDSGTPDGRALVHSIRERSDPLPVVCAPPGVCGQFSVVVA